MTDEQFFVRTLDDIRTKICQPDKYNYLRACGLLRQLLIDGNPLIYKVNQKHKLEILFKINKTKPPDNYFLAFWVDLSHYDDGFKEVELKEFLNAKILTLVDIGFSVLDLLHTTAYVQGGVHRGTPIGDQQKLLAVLDEHVIRNQGLSLKSIKAICDITLNALKPLEDMIKLNTPAC